jgi:hypothetical protein
LSSRPRRLGLRPRSLHRCNSRILLATYRRRKRCLVLRRTLVGCWGCKLVNQSTLGTVGSVFIEWLARSPCKALCSHTAGRSQCQSSRGSSPICWVGSPLWPPGHRCSGCRLFSLCFAEIIFKWNNGWRLVCFWAGEWSPGHRRKMEAGSC